ncbi:MAG: hypothetical protein ACK4MV_04365 [Beijerinckiaceae bacterium]
MPLRLLAFAAVSGRAAFVFFVANKLRDWAISPTAAESPDRAVAWVAGQVEELGAEVIVTERTDFAYQKGDPAKAMIDAVARLAEDNRQLLDARVRRERPYANKYEEAQAIAAIYPELTPWLCDKRPFHKHEPANMVLFEAMALALEIIRDPTRSLAAAMG